MSIKMFQNNNLVLQDKVVMQQVHVFLTAVLVLQVRQKMLMVIASILISLVVLVKN